MKMFTSKHFLVGTIWLVFEKKKWTADDVYCTSCVLKMMCVAIHVF